MKNLQRQKDVFVKKLVKAVDRHVDQLDRKKFQLKWYRLGGRDEDYLHFHFENEETIELSILFWIKGWEEDIEQITFSCFRKKDSDQIESFFDDRVLLSELPGEDLVEKTRSLFLKINTLPVN